MGKTVFVRSLLRGRDRVIVLDPCLEYEADHYDDLGELVESLERRPETFRVRTQWPKDLPVLCAVANSMGSTTLVIEEAQASIPPSNEPLPAALENVIYRGRHFVTEGRDLGTS